MKNLFVLATTVATMFLASCGATKPATVADNTRPGSPFGETFSIPNGEFDTDDYFGASGIASGPKARMGELYSAALTNAQNIVRQKMAHAYKGAIDDYMLAIGNNAGTDYQSKIERGGTQIIDAIVNDTRETNPPVFSAVDEKGNVTCYVGVRVYKNVITDKLAENVIKNVSEDEELKIRFKEDQFRQRMEENFKKFKEN